MAKRKRKQLVSNHVLVPPHVKLTVKERDMLFKKYGISSKELPKIKVDDPAIAKLHAKEGDVIKITRNSLTAGIADFYRGVISE